ncbi:UNVERIFIED_CONTAM: 3-oxoacyl-[acyl-carrier-protein] synthase I, chloroplastic [Sesamum calycinum]|uniref:beta-ketoacyl-[acyl-carrier-protein] synthase I n=1 Tax=Sesamum calycinum TaxID=2727403 RepID=A0AAW2Q718_9LAMI
MGSALLAIDLGLMGPNYSISTACATSNYCFYAAANHIRRGEADLMIAGGTEAAIIPIGLGGFVACRALSQRNDDPKTASRPWDKDRDGFVMGEGAGVLVMESLEHAMKRDAPIIAEYLGGASALEDAGVSPEEHRQFRLSGQAMRHFHVEVIAARIWSPCNVHSPASRARPRRKLK